MLSAMPPMSDHWSGPGSSRTSPPSCSSPTGTLAHCKQQGSSFVMRTQANKRGALQVRPAQGRGQHLLAVRPAQRGPPGGLALPERDRRAAAARRGVRLLRAHPAAGGLHRCPAWGIPAMLCALVDRAPPRLQLKAHGCLLPRCQAVNAADRVAHAPAPQHAPAQAPSDARCR